MSASGAAPGHIRIFISVGDKDLLNPNVMHDGMHDWVETNHRMARVLKEKGYEYQYLSCRGAGHGVGNAQAQFLPHAIEWVWKGLLAEGREVALISCPAVLPTSGPAGIPSASPARHPLAGLLTFRRIGERVVVVIVPADCPIVLPPADLDFLRRRVGRD